MSAYRGRKLRLYCKAVDRRGRVCGRFVGEVVLLNPHPHIGEMLEISKVYCQHCGERQKNKYTVGVVERRSEKQKVEAAMRARLGRKQRALPAPKNSHALCAAN